MISTKEKILQVGAEIVRQKGFNYTGIQEILKKANVPKGSFYFYFNNKEHFGLELIDVYISYFNQEMEVIIADSKKSGLQKLRMFFRMFNSLFKNEHYSGGCPLGNLAQEMGDINDKFSSKLKNGFTNMEKMIELCLNQAKREAELSSDLDINNLSSFIINSWEGAVVRMKVEKSIKPLKILEDYIFNKILN